MNHSLARLDRRAAAVVSTVQHRPLRLLAEVLIHSLPRTLPMSVVVDDQHASRSESRP